MTQRYHARRQDTYKEVRETGRRIHNMDELVELWFFVVRRIKRKYGIHHPEVAELFSQAIPIYLDAEVLILVFEFPGDMFRVADALQTTALYGQIIGCLDGPRDVKLMSGNWTFRRVDDWP